MPKIKRESRQFIVINEEKLITEVQSRPILYDKALRGYRKPAIREGAWQEVAVALESTVDECKKRWRSLRDAFMKQLKLYQRGDANVKKRWLFYEQMEFLAPFFENNPIDTKYEVDEEYIDGVNSSMDNDASGCNKLEQHIVCITNDDGEYNPHHIEIDEYQEDELDEEYEETVAAVDQLTASVVGNKDMQGQNNVYILKKSSNNVNNKINGEPNNQQHGVRPAKVARNSDQNDPDERFLLSCLPSLKRLSNKKNALARLKIQQLLFDIEFDDGIESNVQ